MRRAITEAFAVGAAQGSWPTHHAEQPRHPAHRDALRAGLEHPGRGLDRRQPALRAGPRRPRLGTRRARAAAGLLLGHARRGVPLPGRGARAARGPRPARRSSPGPRVRPDRRRADRTRRLPGARCRGRPMPVGHVRLLADRGRRPHRGCRRRQDWGDYAVARQDGDPSSMLALYRRLVGPGASCSTARRPACSTSTPTSWRSGGATWWSPATPGAEPVRCARGVRRAVRADHR